MNQQKQTELILALDCEDRKLALDLIAITRSFKGVKIGLHVYGLRTTLVMKSNLWAIMYFLI